MDQKIFPRTYRFKPLALVTQAVLSGLLAALFASSPLYFSEQDHPYYWIIIPIGLGWAVAFAWITVRIFFMKLVLEDTRLIYTGYLGTRIIARSDVLGTRNLQNSFGLYTIDLDVRGKRRAPTITLFGPIDEGIEAWLDDIPNAEYEAAVEVSDQLMANPAFGKSDAQRERGISISADILNWLRWPTLALAVWGFSYPNPYNVCLPILMAWPAVALVAVALSGGRWTLNEFDGTHGAGGVLAMGPALALGLRAFLDNQVIDWWLPLLWAFPAAIILILLAAAVERRFDLTVAAITAIVYFAYAGGGLSYLNVALDNQPWKTIQVRVLEAKAYDDSYELTLEQWASRETENTVEVSRRTYEQAKAKGQVCIIIHPGALTWPWYEAGLCPSSR